MTEEILNRLSKSFGDDINKVISLVNSCIAARDRVIEGSSDPNLQLGSIVFDTRDCEIGFVVGPVDVFGVTKRTYVTSNKLETGDSYYIIITKVDKDDSNRLEKDSFNFRVRYIKRKSLLPLKLDSNIDDLSNNSTSDLDIFCSNQCIMECSSECKLYKYKKKK